MGHDIYGYKDESRDIEIAYLRRGAFNDLARSIYIALGAEDKDCGCSGCGETAYFTADQLQSALSKVPGGEEYAPERKFLDDVIGNLDGAGAWIGFY